MNHVIINFNRRRKRKKKIGKRKKNERRTNSFDNSRSQTEPLSQVF